MLCKTDYVENIQKKKAETGETPQKKKNHIFQPTP